VVLNYLKKISQRQSHEIKQFSCSCWSSVGKAYWSSGAQKLSLGSGCNITATAMHELLHALGFWHEQARADRNLYVEVMWENIREGLLLL
jgi:hypothetical protein